MKSVPRSLHWLAVGILGLACVSGPSASAQQHRATHLGNPATRFAPPLSTPEDLRRLFADERLAADVASILRQGGYRGDVEDLRRAARTADIRPVRLPKGTRMPYMSTRRNGRAIALIDVMWVGAAPIEAFAFEFESRGRRYRCVTPKPCSNFFVIDLGPLPRPSLRLVKTAPSEATICEPMEVRLLVVNAGGAPASGVQVSDVLPDGMRVVGGDTIARFDAGDLAPNASREFRFQVVAGATGTYTNRARATTADRQGTEAVAVTTVRGPVLSVRCDAPAGLPLGQPVEVCLTVSNVGDAPEPHATVSLPVPAGLTFTSATEGGRDADGFVVWELSALAPGADRKVCATFTAQGPGSAPFAATVRGACSTPVETQCATQVSGIAAVLLEVVDLEDPVEVGKDVIYEVRVLNQGNGPLTNVRFVGTLAGNQQYVSGSGVTAVAGEGTSGMRTEPLAELAPKAEAVWRVVVRATDLGDTRFKVDLTADQFPRPVEEWEATTQY